MGVRRYSHFNSVNLPTERAMSAAPDMLQILASLLPVSLDLAHL